MRVRRSRFDRFSRKQSETLRLRRPSHSSVERYSYPETEWPWKSFRSTTDTDFATTSPSKRGGRGSREGLADCSSVPKHRAGLDANLRWVALR